MRGYFARNRTVIEGFVLAAVLPWVAGVVNATGFFAVGQYTSHVTGHVARIGDDWAAGNFLGAWQAAVLVSVFLVGAVLATALVESARRKAKARYAGALLVESAVLAAFAVGSAARPAGPAPLWLSCALCLSMGMQNALVTRLSGAVVRTTHLTGVVTDMGVELVRAALWGRDEVRKRGLSSPLLLLGLAANAPELRRLRLHLLILGSFLAGAISGPVTYLRYGASTMFIPVLALLGLVAFDAVFGLSPPDARGASSTQG